MAFSIGIVIVVTLIALITRARLVFATLVTYSIGSTLITFLADLSFATGLVITSAGKTLVIRTADLPFVTNMLWSRRPWQKEIC